MGREDRQRAKRRRAELIERLGGKCKDCGSTRNLEVDHPDGRNYDIRRMGSSWRTSQYLKEEREGVRLECRCKSCNSNAHK
jgi:hypothetical protein